MDTTDWGWDDDSMRIEDEYSDLRLKVWGIMSDMYDTGGYSYETIFDDVADKLEEMDGTIFLEDAKEKKDAVAEFIWELIPSQRYFQSSRNEEDGNGHDVATSDYVESPASSPPPFPPMEETSSPFQYPRSPVRYMRRYSPIRPRGDEDPFNFSPPREKLVTDEEFAAMMNDDTLDEPPDSPDSPVVYQDYNIPVEDEDFEDLLTPENSPIGSTNLINDLTATISTKGYVFN